jgi:diguanylate cyclase
MRQTRTLSLRARLLLLVLMGAIPALVIIVVSAIHQRNIAVADAERDAKTIVNLTVREQNHLLLVTRGLLSELARLPAIGDPRLSSRCNEILSEIKKLHPYFANLGVAGTDGEMYCSAEPLRRPVNVSDRAYFQRAFAGKDVSVGDYQVGRVTGKIVLGVGYPVLDVKGNTKAVVFAGLDAGWINQLLTKVLLPADSMVAIIDSAGTVVTHHPDPGQWMGTSLRGTGLMKAIFSTNGQGTAEVAAFGEDRLLTAFVQMDESTAGGTLYAVAGIPSTVIDASVRNVFYRNLVLLGIAGAIVLVVVWFGGNIFVLRRMQTLSSTALRLREGDLTARTGLLHGTDELGNLAATFDTMAESLERRQREITRSTRALRALTAATRTIVRASSEQDLLDSMCRVIVHVGGYGVAWIGYAFDDERKTVERVSQAGLTEGALARLNKYPKASWAENELGQEPVGIAIRTRAPVVVRDVANDPGHAPWRVEVIDHGFAAAGAFPLIVDGKAIGAIGIYANEVDAFDAEEMRLLEEMADDLAYGIAAQRTREENARAHETIRRMAYYDPLTKLPNPAQLELLIKQIIDNAGPDKQSNALLLIDINGFREINEAVGLHQANMVLKEIGPRLRALVREQDVIARMRGDEFAVVLPGADADEAVRMADRIRRVLNVRFALGSISLDIAVSIGIVMFPEQGREIEALVRRADVALYHARRSASGYVVYAAALDKNTSQRLSLAADLREAIEMESPTLELYYQPKIDVVSGRVAGVEALARWRNGNSIVAPDEFIVLAENTGLIGPLTERLLRLAAAQSRAWAKEGIRLPIAVNLSARNLQDDILFEKIKALRDEFSGKGALEFEITESALMTDPTHSLEVLTKLHLLGIPLYIDDFGTGYSSLSYLQKLPVDAIKVDKSFVIDMLRSKDSATIVQSVISLVHDLGLRVVAEGVETEAALDRLQSLGCDVVQGYHIAKPMPASAVPGWIAGWVPKPRKKGVVTRMRRPPRDL